MHSVKNRFLLRIKIHARFIPQKLLLITVRDVVVICSACFGTYIAEAFPFCPELAQRAGKRREIMSASA